MNIKQHQDLIWGAAAGAVLGLAYQLYEGRTTGDIASALKPTLLPLMIVGALAGIAAVWVRRWSGPE